LTFFSFHWFWLMSFNSSKKLNLIWIFCVLKLCLRASFDQNESLETLLGSNILFLNLSHKNYQKTSNEQLWLWIYRHHPSIVYHLLHHKNQEIILQHEYLSVIFGQLANSWSFSSLLQFIWFLFFSGSQITSENWVMIVVYSKKIQFEDQSFSDIKWIFFETCLFVFDWFFLMFIIEFIQYTYLKTCVINSTCGILITTILERIHQYILKTRENKMKIFWDWRMWNVVTVKTFIELRMKVAYGHDIVWILVCLH
jgi:hypothetical protein